MKSKMVRTRGGGSSNLDRVRPTATVKRRRGGASTSVQNEHFEYHIEEEEEVEIDDDSYPRGPVDKSLLINYEHPLQKNVYNAAVIFAKTGVSNRRIIRLWQYRVLSEFLPPQSLM